MLTGIAAGLATCALWGLTFVAPRVVDPFTTWDLTVARYGLFGLSSLLLMLHPRFRIRGMSARRIGLGLGLGAIGYVGYFIVAAYAVRLAGAAIPPLVIGALPVILATIANVRHGSIAWSRLAPPFALIGGGVLVVNVATFAGAAPGETGALLLGLGSAVLALLCWIVYGLANGEVMAARDAPDALRWTGVQGLGAGAASLLLLPLTDFSQLAAVPADVSTRFIIWVLVLSLAACWLATWMWTVASRLLPLALSAQLIVAETLFGLLFGFLYEGRWPNAAEWIGCLLQLSGVFAAVAAFRGSRRPATGGAKPVKPAGRPMLAA